MHGLKNITIRGFKSIRRLDSFELRPLNVLIGPNGCGKTAFIDLFRMLESSSKHCLQSFVAEQGGPQNLIFSNKKEQCDSMSVGLEFDSLSYHCTLIPDANRLVFENENVLDCRSSDPPYVANHATPNMRGKSSVGTLLDGNHDESRLTDPSFRTDNPAVVPAIEAVGGFRSFRFGALGDMARMRQQTQGSKDFCLAHDGRNLLPFLWNLSIRFPNEYRQVISMVDAVCPSFGGFIFHGDTLESLDVKWYRLEDEETLLSLHLLSSGALRFIALTTLLLQPPELLPQLILIDEPESGLHPLPLALLAEMLVAASDQTQLIVATQSPDLVSEMQPEDVIIVDIKGGQSVFTRLDTNEVADWLQDYSLGELWKTNVFGGYI